MSRQQVEGVGHGCRRHTERVRSVRLGHKCTYMEIGKTSIYFPEYMLQCVVAVQYISKEAWCGKYTGVPACIPK